MITFIGWAKNSKLYGYFSNYGFKYVYEKWILFNFRYILSSFKVLGNLHLFIYILIKNQRHILNNLHFLYFELYYYFLKTIYLLL